MAMKLDFICCIGGELKDVISGTTKNSRIYMYRAYENQTIADMTQDGFFNQAQELRENDLIVLFDPENDNAYDMVKVSSVRGGIVKTTKVQTPDIKTIFARLKELSEKIDKEITDRTKADSVLQKQITTNANNIATNTGNITTLRNDVDGLGDQVHEIEAKIPQNATASNQLATKADLDNVSVAVDGATITKKTDGKIQAIAVVNQNTGVLKSWTGTLAQYTALETKSDDTQYIITDDDSAGTNVYTKAEVDALVNSALASADYVIAFQAPTSANGYTWYRKYKSGWVEQGGRYPNRQNISTTMPVEMSDTNYSVVLTYETDSGVNPTYSALSIAISKTTTSFTIKNAGSIYGGWQVSGMAAA